MREWNRIFLVALLVLGLLTVSAEGLFAQDASAEETTMENEELSESLRKALVELVRAGGYMKSGDIERSVAKYMEAFFIDEGILLYDAQGILNEILRRYGQSSSAGAADSKDTRQLKVKLKSAEVEIEQLTREKERLEGDIQNLQEQFDETSQEMEEKIAQLEADFEEMRHQRTWWRGRYLRKQGYGYSGAQDGEQ